MPGCLRSCCSSRWWRRNGSRRSARRWVVGARDRGRPRHHGRDRQARGRHPQEEPEAVDDRHREGVVPRQGHRLPRGRRRADGRRLAHGGRQRRGLERQGDRPRRARRRPVHLARERDRPGAAGLRPDGPRQQPPQADGRGPATLPPDEAGPARGHPGQGLRRGEDDLPLRVRRPRPQARVALDAADRLPGGGAVLRADGPDRQRQRLGRDVPAQRHAGLRPPREGRHVQRDLPQLPERPEGAAASRRASSSPRSRPT